MTIERDDLEAVDASPRVALPAGFAIASHVLEAAARWPITLDVESDDGVDYYRCGTCGQGIAPAGTRTEREAGDRFVPGLPGRYVYDPEQLRGLVVAHLMQAHGFTREKTGG